MQIEHTDFSKQAPLDEPRRISRYSIEQYLDLVKSFHGYIAPGLLAGGFMVELALHGLPAGILFNAYCETQKCLPDAVQLLTPCTIGNGWLKILDFGRFALCLYEKYTGQGVRVFLDVEKIKTFPAIEAWFFKLQPKNCQNQERLLAEITQADTGIYSLQNIKVLNEHLKPEKWKKQSICRMCGEAFPEIHGLICRGCQGQAPYAVEGLTPQPLPARSHAHGVPPLRGKEVGTVSRLKSKSITPS